MWNIFLGNGYPQVPLIATAAFCAALSIQSGITWNDLEEHILETIKTLMQAVLILITIGMLVGTWIAGGIVPTMVYYGLKILSPKIFLLATLIITSIVSIATGSSWTTVSKVGVALIGVAQGLGVPVSVTAGAIISGSYFGDKMSPLSETTNLAPAVAGTTLFEHIRHMIYTTGVSYVLSIVFFTFMSFKYAGVSSDQTSLNIILDSLQSQFWISPILILPPVLVIFMVIKKIPALPGLLVGVIIGGVFAVIQGNPLSAIVDFAHFGYSSNTGIEMIDSLKKCSCTNVDQNYYLFDYYDEVLQDIETAINVDFSTKIRTLQQIKKNISKTKKQSCYTTKIRK